MTNNTGDNLLQSKERLGEIAKRLEENKIFPMVRRIIYLVLNGEGLDNKDSIFIDKIEKGVFSKDKELIIEVKSLIDEILPPEVGALCV